MKITKCPLHSLCSMIPARAHGRDGQDTFAMGRDKGADADVLQETL
jgi:hypothetical protein